MKVIQRDGDCVSPLTCASHTSVDQRIHNPSTVPGPGSSEANANANAGISIIQQIYAAAMHKQHLW